MKEYKIKYDLLLIYPGYAHYNFHFFDELNRISKNGKKIKVLFVRNIKDDSNFYTDHIFDDNFSFEVLNFPGFRVIDYNFKRLYEIVFKLINEITKSKCIITSTQAPLHSKISFLIAKLYKRKIAVIVEQWRITGNKSFWSKQYEKLGFGIIQKSNMVFVHGEQQKDFVINKLKRKKNVLILPFLSRTPKYVNKERNYENIRILYFGRIIPQKGLDILIKAFINVQKKYTETIILDICGDYEKNLTLDRNNESFDYLKYCKGLSKDNPNIIFHGNINPNNKDNYFNRSHIFVHPHSTYKNLDDGWGLVINEAISYGLPVILTNRVGCANTLVIDKLNGYIIEAGNVDILTNKINELITNPALIKEFSNESFKIFDAYHDPNKIEKLLTNFIEN